MESLKQMWLDRFEGRIDDGWWRKKAELHQSRGYDVLQIQGQGALYRELVLPGRAPYYEYFLHVVIVLKKASHFYIEELTTPFSFETQNGIIINHQTIANKRPAEDEGLHAIARDQALQREGRFSYDAQAAVKYAERWWNGYNPDYRRFDVDCTNYISQCLFAGGAPMRGAPDRDSGWWYQDHNDNWSFSWSVAHAMRWYLSGSTTGLKGAEVDRADELNPGDVICYDFEGDGRWDHNTIVVAKDADGMPLVNAHTDNSRMRYWSYEDSLAWTPDIDYKFFRIG